MYEGQTIYLENVTLTRIPNNVRNSDIACNYSVDSEGKEVYSCCIKSITYHMYQLTKKRYPFFKGTKSLKMKYTSVC